MALDGILYIGTTRGNLWRVPLQALARATRIVLEAPPGRGLGQASLEVRAPLLATSNRILVATMDGTLRGFEPRPFRLVHSWTSTLGPPGVYQMSSQGCALAGPVLAPEGNRIYLALRDRVLALDPEDGQVAWERPLEELAETPPGLLARHPAGGVTDLSTAGPGPFQRRASCDLGAPGPAHSRPRDLG